MGPRSGLVVEQVGRLTGRRANCYKLPTTSTIGRLWETEEPNVTIFDVVGPLPKPHFRKTSLRRADVRPRHTCKPSIIVVIIWRTFLLGIVLACPVPIRNRESYEVRRWC